jgi:hypothetical protein
MTSVRSAFDEAADFAVDLLGDPAVADHWAEPSALAEPADRVVLLPWGPWSLTLDDMLITRIMEIAVHGDDLAYTVGSLDLQLPEATRLATLRS